MSTETILYLLAIVAIGTYFQTLTGFGLGIILMGANSGLDLAPVATVAALVSIVTLANSAVSLPGNLHHIDWRAIRAVLLGVLPAIIGGVLLLDYLSTNASNLLQLLLGAIIVFSGIIFAARPRQLSQRSTDRSFAISGILAGLSGGLFGMAGPPVIFHFYRQPLAQVAIRNMLLLVFAITAASRTLFVAYLGRLDLEMWTLAALTLPLVGLVTFAARRYPPPIAATTMRRIVFVVMVLLGLYLVLTAASQLLTRH
ncbi:MAG TPA: sulfite exporter TauE/SafE family protein [Rhodocyclaceae bacterium]|jgi:uncharacterized protein|nr:sulfite exporter TauE/SafE family protein [Rhodocyclaceae bacterium]